MLITEKLPPGYIYPQITQVPISYAEFLNHFRGGHTIDDNLNASPADFHTVYGFRRPD